MRRGFLVFLAVLAVASAADDLPAADQVLANYVQGLGGEAALKKIATRTAAGTIEVPTYGAYGRYRELAAAPNRLLRTFTFEHYAVLQRGFDGERGWEESPEYGVEELSGVRLEELRRQSSFFPALDLRRLYAKVSVVRRIPFEETPAFEVLAVTPAGAQDTLWFDALTGLLLGIEFLETFQNGVTQRARMLYEDYRTVDGVRTPHGLRYESPRLIWIVKRQVAQNVPVEDAAFRRPD